jgi:hypothetical protein
MSGSTREYKLHMPLNKGWSAPLKDAAVNPNPLCGLDYHWSQSRKRQVQAPC